MSTFSPIVSVVVPVYNGGETIAACVESLLNQDYPADAYEIIVVENGSTDNTTQVVEQYPVRLLHSDKRGPSPARNMGIANSESEIIAFTDADCVAKPNWLAELVKPYADPAIGGVGGTILAHTREERSIVELFCDENPPFINFVSGESEYLPHLYTGNASYRRSLLNKVGGFNLDIITAEDVDLSWQVQIQAGTKLGFAPEAIVYHHHFETRKALARRYRQYGFGEIMLDTMYGQYPGYPRNRNYQLRCIVGQAVALPRYVLSALLRRVRLATGQATPYQAAVPQLWLLIESNNIRGKIEGLMATRFMADAKPLWNGEAEALVSRVFPGYKRMKS